MTTKLCAVSAILLACLPWASAFFGLKSGGKSIQSSPLAEEAIAVFGQKFPFGREPPKSIGLGDFGMPTTDIDGTRVKSKNPSNKRMTDITPEEAQKSFNELARLYGEERALGMVKAQPICLAFDSSNFQATRDAWTEVFGLEATQEMVARNPGLLAVRAEEAAKATDSTMAFSYVVAFTRPLGPFLLGGLLLLLLTPVIESITGIQYGILH